MSTAPTSPEGLRKDPVPAETSDVLARLAAQRHIADGAREDYQAALEAGEPYECVGFGD